jgi:pimeloyl-ACP methyl ester carboxylesterase
LSNTPWGGGIGLAMAQRFPARISRLVLLDASGLTTPDVLTWRALKVPVVGELMTKLVRRSDVRSGLELAKTPAARRATKPAGPGLPLAARVVPTPLKRAEPTGRPGRWISARAHCSPLPPHW